MTGLDDLAVILVAVGYTMIGFLLGIIWGIIYLNHKDLEFNYD